MTQTKRPKVNSESEKELQKMEDQFDAFEKSVEELTMDRMKAAPKEDLEPQTKIAQEDIRKSNELYLKPIKTIPSREKFNDKFKSAYNYDKEYVNFIAEHKELIGETIELWTKPYPGVPCEYWKVPTNKPLWGPRHLAEQIKRKNYHRLRTEDRSVETDKFATYTGQMVVDTTIQRLDAIPVSSKKSIFMGK